MEIYIFELDPANATFSIQLTEVNSTKVNISWNAVPVCSQGANGLRYELEVRNLVFDSTLKNNTNTTSYIFMGFSHLEAHKVTIIPTNSEGKGAPSRKNFITPEGRKLIVD